MCADMCAKQSVKGCVCLHSFLHKKARAQLRVEICLKGAHLRQEDAKPPMPRAPFATTRNSRQSPTLPYLMCASFAFQTMGSLQPRVPLKCPYISPIRPLHATLDNLFLLTVPTSGTSTELAIFALSSRVHGSKHDSRKLPEEPSEHGTGVHTSVL